MKGTLAFFTAAIFITFFLVFMFGDFAIHNAAITCPNDFSNPPADILSYLWTSINILVSPCSGLPFWVYILIFGPLIAAMVAYLTPFIGD